MKKLITILSLSILFFWGCQAPRAVKHAAVNTNTLIEGGVIIIRDDSNNETSMFKISLDKEDSFEYSTSFENILLLLRTIYQNNDFITTTSQEAEELVKEINEVKKDDISSDEQTSTIDIDVPNGWHKKDQKGIICFIKKLVNEHQSKQKDYIRLLSISLDSAMKRRALKRMEFALKAATTGGDTEALVSQWADIDRSISQEVQ